jgi:hypothetical protein
VRHRARAGRVPCREIAPRLHLVAPAEDALALPLRLLREAYGPRIEIGQAPFGQPVMEVRIGLEKYALPLVRAALLSRGANASEKAHCYHWRESTREHSCRE